MGRGVGKVSRPSARTLRPICFSCSERTIDLGLAVAVEVGQLDRLAADQAREALARSPGPPCRPGDRRGTGRWPGRSRRRRPCRRRRGRPAPASGRARRPGAGDRRSAGRALPGSSSSAVVERQDPGAARLALDRQHLRRPACRRCCAKAIALGVSIGTAARGRACPPRPRTGRGSGRRCRRRGCTRSSPPSPSRSTALSIRGLAAVCGSRSGSPSLPPSRLEDDHHLVRPPAAPGRRGRRGSGRRRPGALPLSTASPVLIRFGLAELALALVEAGRSARPGCRR